MSEVARNVCIRGLAAFLRASAARQCLRQQFCRCCHREVAAFVRNRFNRLKVTFEAIEIQPQLRQRPGFQLTTIVTFSERFIEQPGRLFAITQCRIEDLDIFLFHMASWCGFTVKMKLLISAAITESYRQDQYKSRLSILEIHKYYICIQGRVDEKGR